MPTIALARPQNCLLARLPAVEHHRLYARLRLVPLKLRQVLYQAQAPITHAYFPIRGVVSAVIVMGNGNAIEVGTVGREGVIGLPCFLRPENSTTRVVVQVAGEAYRVEAEVLENTAQQDGPLRQLLYSYQSAFLSQISQAVACNGLHTVLQRSCRWILESRNRMESDTFSLTHELLSIMLGVRRATVSEVIESLQKRGLIRSVHGRITVLNLKGLEEVSCECYGTIIKEFARLLP